MQFDPARERLRAPARRSSPGPGASRRADRAPLRRVPAHWHRTRTTAGRAAAQARARDGCRILSARSVSGWLPGPVRPESRRPARRPSGLAGRLSPSLFAWRCARGLWWARGLVPGSPLQTYPALSCSNATDPGSPVRVGEAIPFALSDRLLRVDSRGGPALPGSTVVVSSLRWPHRSGQPGPRPVRLLAGIRAAGRAGPCDSLRLCPACQWLGSLRGDSRRPPATRIAAIAPCGGVLMLIAHISRAFGSFACPLCALSHLAHLARACWRATRARSQATDSSAWAYFRVLRYAILLSSPQARRAFASRERVTYHGYMHALRRSVSSTTLQRGLRKEILASRWTPGDIKVIGALIVQGGVPGTGPGSPLPALEERGLGDHGGVGVGRWESGAGGGCNGGRARYRRDYES